VPDGSLAPVKRATVEPLGFSVHLSKKKIYLHLHIYIFMRMIRAVVDGQPNEPAAISITCETLLTRCVSAGYLINAATALTF
jgi:hypothetical protein